MFWLLGIGDWCFRRQFFTDEDILGWGATCVNEANFVVNHTPDTGLIACLYV
jgi:hypothetical protein